MLVGACVGALFLGMAVVAPEAAPRGEAIRPPAVRPFELMPASHGERTLVAESVSDDDAATTTE